MEWDLIGDWPQYVMMRETHKMALRRTTRRTKPAFLRRAVDRNYREWLVAEDAARMRGRIGRLRFLVKEYGPANGVQLFHGELAVRFFEEARWCFVNGQYIACVLLCQCFLENSLRSLLAVAGHSYGVCDKWLERAGFYELIEKACECGIIDGKDARNFHRVREMRVEYVHARPAFSNRRIACRIIKENKDVVKLAEQDARRAVKVMLEINQELRHRVV